MRNEKDNEKFFHLAHSMASSAIQEAVESSKSSQELTDKLHVLRMMVCNILGCMIFNSKQPPNLDVFSIEDVSDEILMFEKFYKDKCADGELLRVVPDGEEIH